MACCGKNSAGYACECAGRYVCVKCGADDRNLHFRGAEMLGCDGCSQRGISAWTPQSGRITPERLAEGRKAMADEHGNPSSLELDRATASTMRERKAVRDARVQSLVNADNPPALVSGPCAPPHVDGHAHRFGATAADTLKCQIPGCAMLGSIPGAPTDAGSTAEPFGVTTRADCDVVCDDCFEKMKAQGFVAIDPAVGQA